jgi:hypothetical protein
MSEHRCHARGCVTPVVPGLLMCGPHWVMVPPDLRRAVLDTYEEGQEVTKTPSREYLAAAEAAIMAVAAQ